MNIQTPIVPAIPTGAAPTISLSGLGENDVASHGDLIYNITDNIIPVAGGPADPAVAYYVTPIDTSGYELLVATIEPIIDPSTGALGPPETLDMAIQPVPEPGGVSLLAGLLALALVRRAGCRSGEPARPPTTGGRP